MEEAFVPHHQWGEPLIDYPYLYLDFPNRNHWEPLVDFSGLGKSIDDWRRLNPQVCMANLKLCLILSQTSSYPEFLQISERIDWFIQSTTRYSDNNKIFSYYYGFLCIQLTARTLELGVLDQCGALDELKHPPPGKPGEQDFPTHLAKLAIKFLHGALPDEIGLERVLGQELDPRGAYTFFPKLGGFFESDAEYLLGLFWDDRKAFTVLCDVVAMPGWTVLFVAIWCHVRNFGWNLNTLLRRLRNLLLRYTLNSFGEECAFAVAIVYEIEADLPPGDKECEQPPVDQEDAESLLYLFEGYLEDVSDDRSSIDMMASPFALVYCNALSILPDRIPGLLKSALERTWRILESDKFDAGGENLEAFDYASNALQSLRSVLDVFVHQNNAQRRTSRAACVGVIAHIDFLELMGRLCAILVLPAVDKSWGTFLISKHQMRKFNKNITSLMASFEKIADDHDLGDMTEMRRVWTKVLQYINVQLDLHPQGGPLRSRIHTCRNIWVMIGDSFEFKQHDEKFQCMNPRCPDPLPFTGAESACNRCCWVHYCSDRCQAIHLTLGSSDSHRWQCIHHNAQST